MAVRAAVLRCKLFGAVDTRDFGDFGVLARNEQEMA
jgi:hypothetical protein